MNSHASKPRYAMARAMAQDYAATASEKDIQLAIMQLLVYSGWQVFETSQRVSIERGLIGFPDLIAFKAIGTLTVTLLIECKTARGRMRPSQVEFMNRIRPMLSTTLWHFVCRGLDDLTEGLAVIERAQRAVAASGDAERGRYATVDELLEAVTTLPTELK